MPKRSASGETAAKPTKSQKVRSPWTVRRIAAKSTEERRKQGGDKSAQRKTKCSKLGIETSGVVGHARGHLFGWPYTIKDFNDYRTKGHAGRFEAGTNDRAVSIATVGAYQALRDAMGEHGRQVEDGDLGENILVDGPSAFASKRGGLHVGAKLRVGTAVLQLTEANNPCYRLNSEAWAKHAKAIWGASAPEGNVEKWFKAPECPLCNMTFPGGRGWLAKVLQTGEGAVNDQVVLVH